MQGVTPMGSTDERGAADSFWSHCVHLQPRNREAYQNGMPQRLSLHLQIDKLWPICMWSVVTLVSS